MRIAISYPPLESDKGTPLLSQNRQFQWFKNPTYIYPVVPAQAATLLKEHGYEVLWDDGIAAEKQYGRPRPGGFGDENAGGQAALADN
jgi:anaerobic magnesium-protoporphyrin IX monomethyl ester cyclase